MKSLILVIKGFIMGIANIIPGVSGGTLALTLGIYEQFIGAISHFFSNFKKNICFLAPIGLGILLAVATLSRVIDYSFNHYPIPGAGDIGAHTKRIFPVKGDLLKGCLSSLPGCARRNLERGRQNTITAKITVNAPAGVFHIAFLCGPHLKKTILG